jgi:glycosyltransferase involved in cell wall biosynthesis
MNVGVFFTFGNSLKDWEEAGILEREIQLYKKLAEIHDIKYTLFTYGDDSDYKYTNFSPNISIIPIYSIFKKHNNKYLQFLYSFIIAYKLKNYIDKLSLIKTNQLHGSWVPIILKNRVGCPLFLRTGYDHLYFTIKNKKSFYKTLFFYLLTQISIFSSSKYSVTSKADKKFLERSLFITSNKIIVRPNWVELSKGIKAFSTRLDNHVVAVGRLELQKNFSYLVKELKDTDIKLQIIGEGSEHNKLIKLSKMLNIELSIGKKVTNKELLAIISKFKIFALTSSFEGSPKVLLEAMAQGCVPIVSNIPHNIEIVTNGVNGLVVDLKRNNFRECLLKILNDEVKLKNLSKNAISTIKDNYSFDEYVSTEYKDYLDIITD